MTSFGPFRLDAANQRLYYGSAETHLTHNAAGILDALTKRPNEIVTHDELLDSVWRGIHVQPEVLKVYIAELRRALHDSAANPRYIETIHRRGYRFIGAANGSGVLESEREKSECLVGRVREITFLCELMEKAAGGERQMVFITGEGGIGKTALLNTLIARAKRRPGVYTAFGQVAHARSETEPFSPVLDALGKLLTAGKPEVIAGFRRSAPGWLLQFPSLIDPEEIARIGGQMAGATEQRMIREFADAIDECCSDTMLVLGLDDLHRADPSSLDLLEHVATRPGPARLLVIAAANSATGSERLRALIAALAARRLCDEIKLDVLSRDNVERFLDRRYPKSEVGAVLAGMLYHVSGGVPLFLCSAVQYMEAQGWILKTDRGWISSAEAVRLDELVPPVLTELIELRVRQLSPEEQQILETASIVGPEFLCSLVANALGKPVALVEEACNQIVRRGGWLRSAGFAPEKDGDLSARFRFVHELFREVLLCRQPQAERVRKHQRIAAALEKAVTRRSNVPASELALHFTAGQQGWRSVDYLRAAAATASRRYAGAEAAALLTEAIDLARSRRRASKVRTELEMLNELGTAYFSCGDFDHCSHAWYEAASKAIKHGYNDIALHAMSSLAFPAGWDAPARLRSAANRILGHLHHIEDCVVRADVTIRALALRDIAGEWNASDSTSADEALTQIVRSGDTARIASAMVQCAWFELRNSAYENAIAELEAALPVVLQHDPLDVIRAEWALGWALLHAGQWGRMQSVVTTAAAHARKNGSHRIEALFRMQLAWLHLECGAHGSARNLCQCALEISNNPTQGIGVVMCHAIMSMAAIGLDDAGAALESAQCAFRADPPAETFWRAIAETSTLHAHIMNHDVQRIQETARRLVRLSSQLRDQNWKAVALSACAKAAVATGEDRLAHEYKNAALQLVQTAKLPLAKWRVEAVAAEILGNSRSDAEAQNEAPLWRSRSHASRLKLFDSLGIQDPLRQLAHSGAWSASDGQT